VTTALLREPSAAEIDSVLRGLDPAEAEFEIGTVYLLHLLRPYVAQTGQRAKTFQHYVGHAEPYRLAERLAQHGTAAGARCLEVAAAAGITWELARTWPGGYPRERQVKSGGSARRFCPMCGVRPRNTRPGEQR
jgi:hypothetical protein